MKLRISDFPQPQLPNASPCPTPPANQPPAVGQGYFPSVAPSLAGSFAPADGQQQLLSESLAPLSMTGSLAGTQAVPPSMTPSAPSGQGRQEYLMHKSRLQHYAQKSGLALPKYRTINEGFAHLPKFRSTVIVDGSSYTSLNTFLHRKEAEQDVARLALENVSKKAKVELCPPIHEEIVFCKSILHEFANKVKLEKPTYNTVQHEGFLPAFESSLVFKGQHYTGGRGRSKKEAEQLAARTVIRSLLDPAGNSDVRTIIEEIIKSKLKMYSAGASSTNIPPRHEWRPPKLGPASGDINPPMPASQSINFPIEFVRSEQAVFLGSCSAKRRRKNKKKANKKRCTDVQSSVNAFPMNQPAPCSVAQ